ncbi:hypothetical protein AAF712_004888 [Marasmius tenuissimus]|uniref:Fe2OG dioxygenase domain-containing protein n=1 Tax=Marasmius tenuissimus TaxID=585030 RepID=A0ABR3A3B2_9AGAR
MKHQRNDSTLSDKPESLEKKMKSGEEQTVNEPSFGKAMRSAYDLNRAIERMSCSTKYIGKVVTIWRFEDHPLPSESMREILDQLHAANIAANKATRSFCFGTYNEAFDLKITYPGCEFESKESNWARPPSINESTFNKWLEHAPVSGFGDNKAFETKVDPAVRNAREIPKDGFEVKPKLLEDVAKIWADNFLPSEVRVEPYKIHIYGKGGHFKSHRDTPESSLVGTFLLGIGDYTAGGKYERSFKEGSDEEIDEGNFCIGGIRRTAKRGQWVAFHPDVPHSVERLESGNRAVIAFKIFSLDYDGAKTGASGRFPAVVERAKTALEDIKGSFGIVLQHQYPMGTDSRNLVGSDAVLLAAAQQLHGTRAIEVIPIVVRIIESRICDPIHDEDAESGIDAYVYPFTPFHVDTALNRSVSQEVEASMAWMEDVELDIPFYSWEFKKKAMRWSSHEEEINHTGNESDGTRETSDLPVLRDCGTL